jgi:hypothetical protein
MSRDKRPEENAMSEPKMVTMTEEQFQALITAVRPAPPPPALSEEEQFHALERLASERPTLKEIPQQRVRSRTGATFIPRVVCSRPFPKGRVVELLEYTHPEGLDRRIEEGGLVPDGLLPGKEGQSARGNPIQFKQWKYTNFWKRDLETYVGSSAEFLPPPIAVEQAAE